MPDDDVEAVLWDLLHPPDQRGSLRPLPLEAQLQVHAPVHAGVHVVGVVLRTVSGVRVSNSRGVVVGNDCRLRNRDHYHVEYVTVDPEPLTTLLEEHAGARSALRELAGQPGSRAAIRRFQRAIAPPRAEEPAMAVRQALDPGAEVSIDLSRDIQIGDNTRLDLDRDYVVDEARLSLVELLARDPELVAAFAGFVRGTDARPFREALLRVADRAHDFELLHSAVEIERRPAQVLLGPDRTAEVDGATNGVMIGSGNQVVHQLRVDRPDAEAGDLSAMAELVRQVAGIEPVPRPELPEPRLRQPRSVVDDGPGRFSSPGRFW
ncbi:hypothetical protein [Kibdelosporangium phytohabitans]|uniref:Uncharacterized protein n=1 Tax=Kibdelosporangium phytohabitans TaxID=860235 RepID=A0A0N7F458_9PSEU|nr:hypothetical protein [Kibdelosporangium phytohabitans]ALG10511.1 hypothetical protein AOZ06_29690 [Kibdelosporangium phytohabitans]MBE1461604.1 hypothetical protein [Kibdelosporangium phytohabitans]